MVENVEAASLNLFPNNTHLRFFKMLYFVLSCLDNKVAQSCCYLGDKKIYHPLFTISQSVIGTSRILVSFCF